MTWQETLKNINLYLSIDMNNYKRELENNHQPMHIVNINKIIDETIKRIKRKEEYGTNN